MNPFNVYQDFQLPFTIPLELWYILGGILVLWIALRIFKGMYVVVPPQQAHVVTSGSGRTVYMSKLGKEGEEYASSYIYIPFLRQRNILPLEVMQMEINDIALRDANVAKFRCDIVCWVVITNPVLASERLGKIYDIGQETSASFESVKKDIRAWVEAIARTTAMKLEILELMQDRHTFAQTVRKDIDVFLDQNWGLDLVSLEFLEFHDATDEGFQVIHNLESKQAKLIESDARKVIAEQEKLAAVKESSAERETKEQQAENRRKYREKEILTEQEIALKEQEKETKVQELIQQANMKKVDAERTLTVGQAEYQAQALVKQAEGDRQASILKAEGESQSIILQAEGNSRSTLLKASAEAESTKVRGEAEAAANKARGTAEADVQQAKLTAEAEGNKAKLMADAQGIKAKLEAEAEGKDKLADAQKKFEDAALTLEQLYAARDVLIAQAEVLGKAYENANVNVISGGQGSLFGIPMGPEQGASIASMLESIENITGKSIKSILSGDDKPKNDKEE